MAAKKCGVIFRVTGLPACRSDDILCQTLTLIINSKLSEVEKSRLSTTTAILPSCYNYEEKVALVEFHGGVPDFLSALEKDPLKEWQVEMDDKTDINFDQHFFGLTELYAPKPDTLVTADVISIHDVDGHAYGSWRGRGNLGRMWLRHFLVDDLPSCRTMTYGYNSKLSSHGTYTIMDYGRELVEELKKIRNTDELRKRPLFFIAHGFGGLVLAHCLVKAVQVKEDSQPTLAALYKATYGFLFFSVPHRGQIIDDIQKMLEVSANHPRNALLYQIRKTSDLLAPQLADFINLIQDRKVVSFYETRQTKQFEFDDEKKLWKRTGDFHTVVNAESALLQLPDSIEEKIPIDSDHSMIVKFDGKHSRGYSSVKRKLSEFEHNAPNVVAARFCK